MFDIPVIIGIIEVGAVSTVYIIIDVDQLDGVFKNSVPSNTKSLLSQ